MCLILEELIAYKNEITVQSRAFANLKLLCLDLDYNHKITIFATIKLMNYAQIDFLLFTVT